MRSLLLTACLLLIPSVLHAQSVNVQAPIDFEGIKQNDIKQDDRLDKLEKAVFAQNERLVAALERLAPAVPVKSQSILSGDPVPAPKAEIDDRTFRQVLPGVLENNMGERIVTEDSARVKIRRDIPEPVLDAALAMYRGSKASVIQPIPDPVPMMASAPVSNRYSVVELRSIVRNHFPSGWNGQYADVSPRSGAYIHLQQHGFTAAQTNGLSLNEALGLHAMAHAGLVSPTRGRSVTKTTTTASIVSAPQSVITPAADDGCANGQCARKAFMQSTTIQRTRGGDGYGPLGIVKWR